jgi:mRNA interferase MazF
VERFQPGDVVFAQLIFTDSSQAKNRPVVIIAAVTKKDYLTCNITSQRSESDRFRIELKETDFKEGGLPKDSYIRPNLLMTVDRCLILWKKGALTSDKFDEVRRAIVGIVMGNP